MSRFRAAVGAVALAMALAGGAWAQSAPHWRESFPPGEIDEAPLAGDPVASNADIGHGDPGGATLRGTSGLPADGLRLAGQRGRGRTQVAAAQRSGGGLPLKPARTLHLTARSGTWLSLDVAPDGRSLVFDMLGDLYTLPVGGGAARQITRGLAFDAQPTFSHDGRWIAFVSDRSGADNLWVARPDGGGARQVTFNTDDTTYVSPAWSADDTAVFVSRYRADLNAVELWRFGLDGQGALVVPVRRDPHDERAAFQNSLGAVAAPDGRHLYFARHVGGLNYDEQDSWSIVRRDLVTGEDVAVVAPPPGRTADRFTYFRPALSRDGRWLAYETRALDGNELHVRDLATGVDRAVAAPLDHDALQAAIWLDIAPRYAFTPDGGAILIARAGHIERITLAGGAPQVVPMVAKMAVAVGPSTRLDVREDDGPVRAHLVQGFAISPDGRRVAFVALGQLWVRDLAAGGAARRIETGADAVAQPAWSPDGRHLAYVSWNERSGGALWTVGADGGAPPVRAAATTAFWSDPVWSADGGALLALRSPAAARQQAVFEYGTTRPAELVSVAGGAEHVIASGTFGGRLHFAGDPGQVLLMDEAGLLGVDLASGARRPIATVRGAGFYFVEGSVPVDGLMLSPDRRWLLARSMAQAYVLPMPMGAGGVPRFDLTAPGNPALRLTRIGADEIAWAADGPAWSIGTRIEGVSLAHAVGAITPPAPDHTVDVAPVVARALPAGALVLRGATVLTMAPGGDGRANAVIADADVVVVGDRIAGVGPRGTVPVPAGATVRDVTGRWIVPGFVDEHDHIGEVRRGVLSREIWGLQARLAFGVTTSFDPSTLSNDALAYQDIIDAGLVLGPRLRSTGMAIFSMERIGGLDDARAVVARYGDAYRLGNIKEYRTGNRAVRQWVVMAAREGHVQPTTEGAISLKLDLTQMLDGYANNEHALVAPPLGDDVIGLMVAMRTGESATLAIPNGGAGATEWFGATYYPGDDPKLRRFWPRAAIDAKLGERHWQPLSAFEFPAIARDIGRLQAAGGLVGIGAHGEIPGIGFHWEMEAHEMGGMAPMAVLHAATAGSAEVIGRLHDIGTIQPGKLADLVILGADPTIDVRNTRAIEAVMRGGFLYDGQTLAGLWPEATPAPAPWSPVPAAPADADALPGPVSVAPVASTPPASWLPAAPDQR